MNSVRFSALWQEIKESVSSIASVFLMGTPANIGVGEVSPRNRVPVSWKPGEDLRVHRIKYLSMNQPLVDVRVRDPGSMLEARTMPEVRSLRPPVLKPGNPKPPRSDISWGQISPLLQAPQKLGHGVKAKNSRPNHLYLTRETISFPCT